jgi:DegV family protein with EDD domain
MSHPMIAIVTDSASMLPPVWRERAKVAVAPLTVVIDGVPYREGEDITTAEFYRRLSQGADVSTSAPSPGDLLAIYEAAIDSGATSIVSIHTGSAYSSVLDAATIATRSAPVDVALVDTGTVSFPVALCVVAACDARDRSDDPSSVVAAAQATAAVVDSIFIVGVPELARRGGRLGTAVAVPEPTTILTLGPNGLADLGTAADLDGALARMAAHISEIGVAGPLRIGVGDADCPELGDRLANLIEGSPGVVELTRYEVGPSVGAHSGAGTVGAVWAPV